MQKTSILTIAAALTCIAGGLAAQAPERPQAPVTAKFVDNTLTSEEKSGGWKLLFDGTTTNGWRGFKQKTPPAGWQVIDGTLTRVGEGGDLMTAAQYASFELRLEWKVPPGGNSGVMFRVSEDALETYHTGPEMQILDNARHRDGKNPLTSAGACYALYAPSKDVTRPVGTWNSIRLIVDGNNVQHWLNDVLVVRYELGSPDWTSKVAASKFNEWPQFGRNARGHLVLQDHGDRVAFRNIKIREIASP
jgi:hypothetical protein